MNRENGKDQAQNISGGQGSSNSGHHSRKPPRMEGKCMRCGKPDRQPGQKTAHPKIPSARSVTK